MNICFTLSSLSAGGAERVATSLANQFSKDGHKVFLILVSIDYNNTFYDLDESVHVIPLLKKKKDKNVFRRIKILRKCILDIKPDIVIAFLPHICIYTYFALRKTNIPYICSERNDPNHYSLLYKILLKPAFYNANGTVFQTTDAKSFYKKIDNDTASIIFNPVFLKNNNNNYIKEKKNKLFISVGRLTPQKNFSLLIEAFYEFLFHHPGYKLVIYGEGPERNKLLNLIRKLKLEEQVSLPGTNPDWHTVAVNAEGFISSSNYEGMPNCLEEALCLGCPSIATDCPAGGSKELISLLNFGVLVQPNNKKQLVLAMDNLTKQSLQKKKIDYSELSIISISNKWIDFINKILKNN